MRLWRMLAGVIVPLTLSAQAATAWVRYYNGDGYGNDYAVAVAMDTVGNCYVTGQSYGLFGDYDFVTIKYLANGTTAWVASYDGGIGDDIPVDIAVDNAGNVYVTGRSRDMSLDYLTVKYLPNGDTAWVRTYDGARDFDCARSCRGSQ